MMKRRKSKIGALAGVAILSAASAPMARADVMDGMFVDHKAAQAQFDAGWCNTLRKATDDPLAIAVKTGSDKTVSTSEAQAIIKHDVALKARFPDAAQRMAKCKVAFNP